MWTQITQCFPADSFSFSGSEHLHQTSHLITQTNITRSERGSFDQIHFQLTHIGHTFTITAPVIAPSSATACRTPKIRVYSHEQGPHHERDVTTGMMCEGVKRILESQLCTQAWTDPLRTLRRGGGRGRNKETLGWEVQKNQIKNRTSEKYQPAILQFFL